MSTSPQDIGKHFSFAHGYHALGLLDHAEQEWKQIAAPLNQSKPVLLLGAEIARSRGKWPTMLRRSKELRRLHPEGVDGWLLLSYASRRAESLESAYDVLNTALAQHARDPLVHFNLGCYACLLGRHEEAAERVLAAVRLDRTLAAAALKDPDLEAIRSALAERTKQALS